MGRHKRRAWVSRLPTGLRDQPAWVFIGFLIGVVGLTYVAGISESSISRAVGVNGLRVWGAFLMCSGFGVVWATIGASHALERLSLRLLSICLLVYSGWLLTVVSWQRAAMTLALTVVLVLLAEIRVAVLKALMRVAEEWQGP
jgi:hypothetical protein